jgi:O-antigen/teichoic acid export membrane protein
MMRETGARPSAAAARDLRRFGIPYQIATAGTFVLTFGDRVFLQAFHGLAAVGIYGLAYQFGFVLVNLTSAPFFRAWAPQRLQMASSLPRATRDARYNQAFRYLNVLVIAAAVAISLYAWPLLAIMSAPAFRPAAVVVPVILAAFVVQIWTDVVSLGIEVSEQTRYASYATWMGVALILALYAILIPPLGGLGAALATIGGNLVRFGVSLRAAQRLWPVAWDWHQPVRIAVLGGFIVGASVVVPPPSWAGQLAIATVFMAVFAAAVWVAVLSRRERAQILGLLRAPRTALSGMTSA